MKEQIQELNEVIEKTGVISKWGGWCINYPAKPGMEHPYGIDEEGMLYTYDEDYVSVGYLYIRNIRNKGGSHANAVVVTVAINVFTTLKKQGDIAKSYTRPLALFGILAKNYRNIRITTPNPDRYFEYACIEVDIDSFAPCEFTETANEIC